MTRWKLEFLNHSGFPSFPSPFSPVHKAPNNHYLSYLYIEANQSEILTEILRCFWDKVGVKREDDPPDRVSPDGDIKEHERSYCGHG